MQKSSLRKKPRRGVDGVEDLEMTEAGGTEEKRVRIIEKIDKINRPAMTYCSLQVKVMKNPKGVEELRSKLIQIKKFYKMQMILAYSRCINGTQQRMKQECTTWTETKLY